MSFPLVVVAGATGAIGAEVVRELQSRGSRVRALVREPARLTTEPEEIFVGNLLNPRTLEGSCAGADAVVSCVGAKLTLRMFTYKAEAFHAVDDGGNRSLLREAEEAGVRRFGYVSVYGGRFLGMMEYVRAHESFAAAMRMSSIGHLIVRPTVTFARLALLVEQGRKRGRLSLIGTGQAQVNPVHEADVAKALVDGLEGREDEVDVGGPEVLTWEEIGGLAAAAAGDADVRFSYLWRAQLRAALRRFTGRHGYDSAVYRISESAVDIVAPAVGERRLEDYFASLRAR
ncbi:MAG: NAD(P)H-binding protein [Chloroflexi bacterium]|nr:NAD(P)H-binding protein [Chloroflexota bacterium]